MPLQKRLGKVQVIFGIIRRELCGALEKIRRFAAAADAGC
jgi:hypothetical protein